MKTHFLSALALMTVATTAFAGLSFSTHFALAASTSPKISKNCAQEWRLFESQTIGSDPYLALKKALPELTDSLLSGLKNRDPRAQAALGNFLLKNLTDQPSENSQTPDLSFATEAYLKAMSPRTIEVGLQAYRNIKKRLLVLKESERGSEDELRNKQIMDRMDEHFTRALWDSGLWSIAYVGTAHVLDYFFAHPETDAAYVQQSFRNRLDPQLQRLFIELVDLSIRALEKEAHDYLVLAGQYKEKAKNYASMEKYAEALKLESQARDQIAQIRARRDENLQLAQLKLNNEWLLIGKRLIALEENNDPGLPRLRHFAHRPLLVADVHHRRNNSLVQVLPSAQCIKQKGIREIDLAIENMGGDKKQSEFTLTDAIAKSIVVGSFGIRANDLESLRSRHPELSEQITAENLLETSNFTAFLKKLRTYELAGIAVRVTNLER